MPTQLGDAWYMKLNFNKICFIFLLCLGISLGCFASAISLLTTNDALKYMLLLLTYFQGIILVKSVKKYDIVKKD